MGKNYIEEKKVKYVKKHDIVSIFKIKNVQLYIFKNILVLYVGECVLQFAIILLKYGQIPEPR